MTTETYVGYIKVLSAGEADDILYIDPLPSVVEKEYDTEPFAEILEESISGMQVSVRYWICSGEMNKDQAVSSFMMNTLYGMIAECNYCQFYSEETGFLWCDEDIKIGGHDLLTELKSFVGKYLILEVDIHD